MISKKTRIKKDRKVTIENGHVIKWHKTVEALDQEVRDVKALRTLDRKELGDGWIIRVPKVLEVDKRANYYSMERLGGKTLDLAITQYRNRIPWRQIGAALAIYHQKNECTDDSVYSFGDYNRSNILVGLHKKTIGIIDPGIRHGLQASRYRDILVFERSLWYAQMKYYCWLNKDLIKFRKGYSSVFPLRKLHSAKFWAELRGQWPAIKHGADKKPPGKKMVYLFYGLIWLLKQCIDKKGYGSN